MSEDSKCWKMPNKADTPLTTTYRPDLDISRELNVADAAYFQSLIGISRWIVELVTRFYQCLGYVLVVLNLSVPEIIIS